MTTKLELGQFKNTNKGVIVSKNREIVAELPDKEGVHETLLGMLGIRFEKDAGRGYHYVTLEISRVKDLQTHDHREKRRVNVSNEGKGQIQLSRGRILFISTDAFKKGGEDA